MTVFDLQALLKLDTKQYDDGLGESERKASNFGDGLKSVAKVGAAAFAAIGAAATGVGIALNSAVGGLAEYGDKIDKTSQKMGMSTDAYQEWDAVLQHSGTSIEAMQGSMKKLAVAAETGNDAFAKLGISQEELATMSQEELFSRTIEGLQNVTDGTERTYLASQLLGRGATELGALLNTSAEDTQKMKDRVHELGGVMSEEAVKQAAAYQDSLQDMKTAMDGFKRGLLADFLPSFTTVMDGITSIFAGEEGGSEKVAEGLKGIMESLGNAVPKLMEKGGEILSLLVDTIEDYLPEIITEGGKIAISIIAGIVERIPDALSTMAELMSFVANGISDNFPTIIDKLMSGIENFLSAIEENGTKFLEVGLSLLESLAQGFVEAVPKIIEHLPAIIEGIVNFFVENAPKILSSGFTIIATLVEGIISAIPTLLQAIADLAVRMLGIISETDWVGLGSKVITKIGEGIQFLIDHLPTLLLSIANTAVNFVTNVDWVGLGKSIIDFIKGGISALFNVLPDLLKSIGTTALDLFKKIDWMKLGRDVIDFIKNGIFFLFNDIPKALGDIASSAFDWFKNVDWWGLGSAVVQGIADGVKAMAHKVWEAIGGVATGALDWAKGLLGIHSPSRVFRDQIGKMMALGVGVGFEDNLPVKEMQKTMSDMVDTLSADATLGIKSLTDDLTSFDGLEMANLGDGEGYGMPMNSGNIEINVYARENHDERQIAEQVQRILTQWQRQKRRVFA